MKIGVCLKDLRGDLEENLVWLSENGFEGFQVWQNQVTESKLSLKEFKQRVSDLGLKVSAMGGGPNFGGSKC